MLRNIAETCISISKIVEKTEKDGDGIRISIYAAGCIHNCQNCYNTESVDINNGTWMTIDEIYNIIKGSEYNVTFTGGDPFLQSEAFTELAYRIKNSTNKTIWCYTGFQAEKLIEAGASLLNYIDVLVDGKYDNSKSDKKLKYTTSRNQRILVRSGNYFKQIK